MARALTSTMTMIFSRTPIFLTILRLAAALPAFGGDLQRRDDAIQALYGGGEPSEWSNNWMAIIPNDTLITQMSIPGTHSSMTAYASYNDEESGLESTQRFRVGSQLDYGIRALDFRFGFDRSRNLAFFHESINLSPFENLDAWNIDKIFAGLEQWLKRHPSEAIVLSLRLDHPGLVLDAEDRASIYIQRVIQRNPALYFVDGWKSGPPSIGDVRGKIIIFNGFASKTVSFGVRTPYKDAQSHEPFSIGNIAGHVSNVLRLPDTYTVNTINAAALAKMETVKKQLEGAYGREDDDDDLYLTYTAAVQDEHEHEGIKPLDLADMINTYLHDYLDRVIEARRGEGRSVGIIYMDAPSENLIQRVCLLNPLVRVSEV